MSVEFSVPKVDLVNLYDDERTELKQKDTYYVQNRCSSSRKVRVALSKNSHPEFALLNGADERYLAAGLKLPVVLQYNPKAPGKHCGDIEVYVNEKLNITVPIQAIPPSTILEVNTGVVNFGSLVCEHQIDSRKFTVKNVGNKEGGFTIQTTSLPSYFTVSPKEGNLQPNQSIDIVIEMVCKQCGFFHEELVVIPSDGTNCSIPITLQGDLVSRQLQLLDPGSTSSLQNISFGDTYYETVVSRKALLFNNSPVATQYLALLDNSVRENIGGVDMSEGLAMACTSGGLKQAKWKEQGDAPNNESVVSVTPLEGSLGPYEKCFVEFSFTPRFIKSEVGWTHHQGLPLQRDYSLFVKFMQIGTRSSLQETVPGNSTASHLEVALTGTACPVQLILQPDKIISFGTCNTGTITTKDIQLINESAALPIEYQCRQPAHYKCQPTSGRILPGEVVSMTVTFQPKQLGRLNFKLHIDVIGSQRMSDGKIKNGVVYSAIVDLRGNGGVTSAGKKEKTVRLAHPNDLSTSVRPHDVQNAGVIITPYTHAPRHTYVDPDYSYNEEEITTRGQQKNSYTGYIKNRHAERLWKEKEKTNSNPMYRTAVDMSMPPAQGLTPLNVSTAELTKKQHQASTKGASVQGYSHAASATGAVIGRRMITTTDVTKGTSIPLEFMAQCPNKPSSTEMASQCRKSLSPKELNQVLIDPEVIDFGSVVVNCIAELQVNIKNFTDKFINLKIKLAGSGVSCPSYVNQCSFQLFLSPRCYTQLPFTMCHKQIGMFERSIEYSLNGHQGHLPVKADVTELCLDLSTNTLILTEPPLAIQSAGLHGSVVVNNPHNIPVFFQWLAKEGVETSTFNMMHPTGYVPAKGSLECEFVCQPSYESPSSAQFFLDDGSNNSLPSDSKSNVLTLLAEFKKPECKIREKRVLFGTVPLNVTTSRTIHIDNIGDCHAYYKVIDPSPHPGVRVFPDSGSVAIGGAANLKVLVCPETVGVFDIRVCVSLREGKTLSFRLAGTVEQPTVSIDQELFKFGSVFCGAHASQLFTITHKGSTRAVLTFDFSHLSDFSLVLPKSDDPHAEQSNNTESQSVHSGVYTLSLAEKSSAVCKLEFCPKEVAAYDFLLPVLVNGLKAPTPPPSPWPPSQTTSFITVHGQGASPSYSVTPTRRVLATALRSPLLVPNTQFSFQLPVDFLDNSTQRPIKHEKEVILSNISGDSLTWAFHQTSEFQRLDDGTFQFALHSGGPFSPPIIQPNTSLAEREQVTQGRLQPGESFSFFVLCKPAHHGKFNTTIPLVINGDVSHPYRTLQLSATLPPCQISVIPGCIDVLPVPLGVSLTAQFTVTVQGFAKPVELDVEVPDMKEGVSFSIGFPAGSKVTDCSQMEVELPCTMEFSSVHSVSISDSVVFSDKTTGRKKRLPFTVCADNSIFSIYKFLAQNIHLTTITLGDNHTPTLILQSQSFDSTNGSGSVTSLGSQESAHNDTALSFNPSATFSDMYQQDCVTAVCQWLSAYGWADGMKCLTTPSDLRVRVGNDLPKPGVKQRSSISTSRGLLVDLLTHLCGRVPPGIPLNLPPCTTASEKVNQQYSTYRTVTSFLKSQGGLLWNVVPEALLDYHDYCHWLTDVGGKGSVGFSPEGEDEFNDLSKQAWTHLLMQIVKVLVLPRAISHVSKSLKDVVNTVSALESNVYSKGERVLLAWLNHHYTQQRTRVFGTEELSLSEVVNFDVDLMDCTVFACVLASYCPFLIKSHLSQLFTEPANPEECTHNAIVFIRALRYVGIDYDVQPNDLVSPNPISLMLLTAFLCQRLPTFKPKSTPIVFEGALSSTIKQQVQLSNPSSKTLEYRILILGENAQDFTVLAENNTITLSGKQNGQLSMRYHAKCLSPAEATLLLVARGGRSTVGSTLAFRLLGNATSFKPQSTTTLTASQYDCQSLSINVTNPFKTGGQFEVRLCEMDDKNLLQSVSPKSRKRFSSNVSTPVPASVLQQRSTDQMRLFNCSLPSKERQLVHLEPGDPKSIVMKFVPLKRESRRCFIVLSNIELGDLVLSVSASVKHPQPILPQSNCLSSFTIVNPQTKTLHLKVHAGQSVEEEIVINSSNIAFENAILEISKWEMSGEELRRRQLTESLRYAALTTAIATLGLDNKVKTYKDDQSGESEVLFFSVHGSDMEHFSLPEEIAVPANNNDTSVLPVQFYSDEEGQYECHIVLRSNYDVRVLVIETTVLARGRHAQLEFNTHAMQPVTQDIPLVNPSTADWPLVVSLTGGGFSGPESLVARALTTTCYPLTFNPHTEGSVQGVLHLLNNSDGSEHVFQLRGVAERPLAQDHITLHVQAKKSMTHILHVPNHNERTSVFRVESDLDFISGPSTITIGGGDVVDYCLDVLPKRQGRFSGAIAFVTEAVSRPHSFNESMEATTRSSDSDKSPYHVWFHIDCMVEPAPPDHVITVSSHTLSTSTVQLNVVNPSSEQLVLQALLEGHGLSGPATLEVGPSDEACYPLTFSPTLFGKTDGRIVFNGSPEGEFWYQLILNAEDPEAVSLPLIKSELGRATLQTVCLTNPIDEQVTFTCDNSNTRHFTISGLPEGQLDVAPHSTKDVSVLFNPSALGLGDHTTDLAFISEKIGKQIFVLQGEGLFPTSMDPITINTAINSNTVHIVNFTNPLDLPTHFSVHLRGEDLDHFCLLMKRSSSILLQPGVSLDIPVMFAPEAVQEHQITVVVIAEFGRSQDNLSAGNRQALCWKYPIIGQPEIRPFTPSSAPKFSCCAKERLERTLEVCLAGSLTSSGATIRVPPSSTGQLSELAKSSQGVLQQVGGSTFSYKLKCNDKQFEELVGQCTGIKLVGQNEKEKDGEKCVCLEFGIVFTPPKAFSSICELQVSSSGGGVWLFPLHFSASTAAPDDTIIIESKGLNKESQIGFRLTSMNEHPAPFTAHLAPSSDSDLTVSPTSGSLAPVNSRGTLFCITYQPKTYGRNHRGTLIVQSGTNEWRYNIVGIISTLSRPTGVQARVQHKIDSPIRMINATRKNFVSDNVQKIHVV